MNTVQVDQVCIFLSLLPWWGGWVRQVPVAPRDPAQFTWFVDGESEPAEQLCVRSPCPSLQTAGQSQHPPPDSPVQPAGNLSDHHLTFLTSWLVWCMNVIGCYRWMRTSCWKFSSHWTLQEVDWTAAGGACSSSVYFLFVLNNLPLT